MSDQNGEAPRGIRRVLILGANGPSGRLTVQEALGRGIAVRALTRHPRSFPIRHDRLEVVGGDATRAGTIDAALEGCDAVISVIGSRYTWQPVEVYSASARLVVDAMRRRGPRRCIVVTSMGVPRRVRQVGVVQRTLLRILRLTYTRTLYDDMLRMEHAISTSGLDWTIVRPPALSDDPGRGYVVADTRVDAPAMARADLAAMLVDQLSDERWIARIAAVATPGLEVDVVRTIRREALKL